MLFTLNYIDTMMEDNLIKTREAKEYAEEFRLEEIISKAVNQLVKELPKDPFSFLCSIMKENSLQIYTITDIQIRKVYRQEFQRNLELRMRMSYQGNEKETIRYLIPFTNTLYDKIKDNLDLVIEVFGSAYQNALSNYQIDNFENFDTYLKQNKTGIPQSDDIKKSIGAAIVNSISISSFISMSKMKEEPFIKFIQSSFPQGIVNDEVIPNLGFSLFKTGKSVNSKVKFERFIIFINNSSKIPKAELFDIVQRLYSSIRKNLTAGKAGENGLKLNNEGSYTPPVDNMNDIMKLLETIINEVNVPSKLFYGIDCNANNYYSPQTKTYEMDGFKKPPDTDQIIEFYQKLCTDHPLLQYFEEPIAQADANGWITMKKVFMENFSNIIISNKAYKEVEEDQEKKNLHTEPKKPKHILETIPAEERLKTDGNKEHNDEDDDQLDLNVVSIKFNQLISISELLYTIQRLRLEGDVEINLWDNDVETEQTSIVDFGIGFRINNIILNGFSMKNEKLCKVLQYINLIEEIY